MTSLERFEKIWHVVQCIPVSAVASYGQIADLAGLPGRARLAGKAMQAIPESGFNNKPVPWFRVVRSSGQLAFPVASDSFNLQRALLLEEGVIMRGRTVPLKQYQWRPSFEDLMFNLTQ
jgi:methylated-DNA-protein-cysteine methyltransferase related protein